MLGVQQVDWKNEWGFGGHIGLGYSAGAAIFGRGASRLSCASVADRTKQIGPNSILLMSRCAMNMCACPISCAIIVHLGVEHFLFVDNGSTDGSREYLAEQPDASVWTTDGSYKNSRFGMDWLTHLQRKYAHGKWCVTADVDEFLVYPFCETRPLRALTDWLDNSGGEVVFGHVVGCLPKGEYRGTDLC